MSTPNQIVRQKSSPGGRGASAADPRSAATAETVRFLREVESFTTLSETMRRAFPVQTDED